MEQTAAEQLKMTAHDLLELGICDEIVPEAVGGAHRGLTQTASALQGVLRRHFDELCEMPLETLLEQRYDKFRRIGHLETA